MLETIGQKDYKIYAEVILNSLISALQNMRISLGTNKQELQHYLSQIEPETRRELALLFGKMTGGDDKLGQVAL